MNDSFPTSYPGSSWEPAGSSQQHHLPSSQRTPSHNTTNPMSVLHSQSHSRQNFLYPNNNQPQSQQQQQQQQQTHHHHWRIPATTEDSQSPIIPQQSSKRFCLGHRDNANHPKVPKSTISPWQGPTCVDQRQQGTASFSRFDWTSRNKKWANHNNSRIDNEVEINQIIHDISRFLLRLDMKTDKSNTVLCDLRKCTTTNMEHGTEFRIETEHKSRMLMNEISGNYTALNERLAEVMVRLERLEHQIENGNNHNCVADRNSSSVFNHQQNNSQKQDSTTINHSHTERMIPFSPQIANLRKRINEIAKEQQNNKDKFVKEIKHIVVSHCESIKENLINELNVHFKSTDETLKGYVQNMGTQVFDEMVVLNNKMEKLIGLFHNHQKSHQNQQQQQQQQLQKQHHFHVHRQYQHQLEQRRMLDMLHSILSQTEVDHIVLALLQTFSRPALLQSISKSVASYIQINFNEVPKIETKLFLNCHRSARLKSNSNSNTKFKIKTNSNTNTTSMETSKTSTTTEKTMSENGESLEKKIRPASPIFVDLDKLSQQSSMLKEELLEEKMVKEEKEESQNNLLWDEDVLLTDSGSASASPAPTV